MKFKDFKKRNPITYFDDERMLFNNKIIYPNYSTKNSFKLFNKVLKKILCDRFKNKFLLIKNYNILSIALEDFFWQFCFQYIKYKKFIDQRGIGLKVIKCSKKNYYNIDGYGRVKDYLNGNVNLINIIKFFIKNCYFYFWIFKNLPFNRGKIWIDRRFKKDYRFKNLKKNISQSIVLPYSIQSFRGKNLKIEDALIEDAIAKTKNYSKWIFAIKILKPSKIITSDNLYDNYSLLLAAKIKKIKCEAICHSPTVRYHMNNFGSKFFKKKELLIFDKIFVYHKIFKNYQLKYGHFYNSKQIKVIKWPNTNKYDFKIKKNNKNIYILYPFEHFCNFKKINKFLLFFQNKSHKIIVKTRPDTVNYNHFDPRLNIEFVDDFKKDHFLNCFCVIGSTTGLIFNCSQNFLPIVYIDNNGYDHFKNLSHPKNWIICKNIDIRIYKQIKNYSIKSNFNINK